jgi:hypothetical protein
MEVRKDKSEDMQKLENEKAKNNEIRAQVDDIENVQILNNDEMLNFKHILSGIENEKKEKVKFAKTDKRTWLAGHTAVAKVISHGTKDNEDARTLEIENTKAANQAFGVINISQKLFDKSLTRLRPTHNKTNTMQGQTSHIREDIVNVEDLAGVSEDTPAYTNVNTSDYNAATLRTLRILP